MQCRLPPVLQEAAGPVKHHWHVVVLVPCKLHMTFPWLSDANERASSVHHAILHDIVLPDEDGGTRIERCCLETDLGGSTVGFSSV